MKNIFQINLKILAKHESGVKPTFEHTEITYGHSEITYIYFILLCNLHLKKMIVLNFSIFNKAYRKLSKT